ncbi:hypothetical protein WA538_003363 [Blastocystis sp. DL]
MRAQLLQQIDSEEIHSRKSVDSNHAAEIAETPHLFDFITEKEEISNDFGIPEPPPLPSLERFGLMELLMELEESWKPQKSTIPSTSQFTKSPASRQLHARPFRGDGGKAPVAQRRLAQRPPVTSTRSLTFRPFNEVMMETPRRSKLPLPLVARCPTLRGVSRKMTGEEEYAANSRIPIPRKTVEVSKKKME